MSLALFTGLAEVRSTTETAIAKAAAFLAPNPTHGALSKVMYLDICFLAKTARGKERNFLVNYFTLVAVFISVLSSRLESCEYKPSFISRRTHIQIHLSD